jgi:DNA-binding beta-propeller fold protein YncE
MTPAQREVVSGWIWFAPAILIWGAAVAWPLLSLVQSGPLGGNAGPIVDWTLLWTSLGWAVSIGLVSSIVGWAPGRLIASRLAQRRYVLPLLVLTPLCLPAYAIFTCWWQALPPDSAIQAAAVRGGWLHLLRQAMLAIGLVAWAWPIAAWCVAARQLSGSESMERVLAIDGAPAWRRAAHRLREDASSLLLAWGIVALFTMNNTTCFDLAQVRTFGYEVRTIDAQGGAPGDTLRAALPAIALGAGIGLSLWTAAPRILLNRPGGPPHHAGPSLWTGCLLLAAASPALVLAIRTGAQVALQDFIVLYGAALVNTLLSAAMVGAAIAMLTLSLALTWRHPSRALRALATLVSVSLLLGACVPGTIVALAIESAWNRRALDAAVYDSPFGLMLGGVALLGFLAAWLSRAAKQAEPEMLRSARRLDGALSGQPLWMATRPRLLAASLAAGAIAASLWLGEVSVTARLQRPGFDVIATSVLNAIHYQHPETVVIALGVMLVVGLLAAAIAIAGWSRVGRWAAPLVLLAVAACGPADSNLSPPLPTERAFGSVGVSPGQFDYPRAIDTDPKTGRIFVIDKTARIQRFSPDGRCEAWWQMPEWKLGKPTGVTVGPDGLIYVPDTHYHRVMIFDAEGREVRRFGEYGLGPGQFVYLTDVAFGPDGELYVSEYGGNDRIQVFTPAGAWIRTIGGPGAEPGQFSRPQSIAFSNDLDQLYVADAVNHRIQVLTPQGEVIRVIGRAGHKPGDVSYPYGLEVLDDDSFLVAEFGNNRIQRFGPDGRSLGEWGGLGFRIGRVRYPWGVAAADGTIFVLDSGNNRVQVLDGL